MSSILSFLHWHVLSFSETWHVLSCCLFVTGSFAHGFTYSGHPVACAVAIEALKIYRYTVFSITSHSAPAPIEFLVPDVSFAKLVLGRGIFLIMSSKFLRGSKRESRPLQEVQLLGRYQFLLVFSYCRGSLFKHIVDVLLCADTWCRVHTRNWICWQQITKRPIPCWMGWVTVTTNGCLI